MAPRRSPWLLVAGAAAVLTIIGLGAALFYVTNRAPSAQVAVVAGNADPPPTQALVDEKPPTEARVEAPAQAGNAAAAPVGAAARPRPALAALPGNARVVMRIDVPRLIASPLYQKLLPVLSARSNGSLEPVLRACGQERIKTMKTITIATVGKDDKLAMVIEGLTRKALAECLRGMAAAAGEKWDVRQDGNFTHASKGAEGGKGAESLWFGWLGDAAFVTGAEATTKAKAADMLDGKDGVDGNKRTMALINSTDQKAAIWVVATTFGPSGSGTAPQSLYMSIDLAGGLALTMGLRHANRKTAEATAEALEEQLFELRDTPAEAFLDATRIQARNNDMIISVRLSMDELEKLEELMEGAGDGMDADTLQELLQGM